MSKALKEIGAGLADAIRHAKGRKSAAIVHEPKAIDEKAIRRKTGNETNTISARKEAAESQGERLHRPHAEESGRTFSLLAYRRTWLRS